MYVLIWGGAAVTLFSLVGMLWCIAKVRNARNANLPDDELRLVMEQILSMVEFIVSLKMKL